jgi:hypothetical protein
MNNFDSFLQDILGNIVGNTLTDNQKMILLETMFRMVIELHNKLDRIEHKIDNIEKEINK